MGFEVDKSGIEIVGVSTFSCESCINTVAYEMEFLEAKGAAETKWFCLGTSKGLFNNCISEDYTTISFEKPFPIKVAFPSFYKMTKKSFLTKTNMLLYVELLSLKFKF